MGEERWKSVDKFENKVLICTHGWLEFYRFQDVSPAVSFPSCGHGAVDTMNRVAQSV